MKTAGESYSKAMEVAEAELALTDPLRLGIALNFAVFKAEYKYDIEGAINLASRAFDAAVSELDALEGEDYKSTENVLILIRENITLWNNGGDDDLDEDDW